MAPGIVITAFVAIVGLAALATAIRFAIRPTEHGLAVLRPLSATTTFAALTAFLLGITNGLVGAVRRLEQAGDAAATAAVWRTFLAGLAEATVPLILAFALLTVAWLLAAVGLRKQA
jgi:ABC-type arginine transport system permease subunit